MPSIISQTKHWYSHTTHTLVTAHTSRQVGFTLYSSLCCPEPRVQGAGGDRKVQVMQRTLKLIMWRWSQAGAGHRELSNTHPRHRYTDILPRDDTQMPDPWRRDCVTVLSTRHITGGDNDILTAASLLAVQHTVTGEALDCHHCTASALGCSCWTTQPVPVRCRYTNIH